MAVTYGFYDSLNGDRKYNAEQFTSIFDGIINDGVLSSIGDKFAVTANSGMTINVGTGRAWFNHTWTYNDASVPITLDSAEALLNRIDAVVLEINKSAGVRANTIKVIKGTPSSNPTVPSVIRTSDVNQYYLATILIKPGTTDISQSMITNRVGTSETPYVTGLLQQITTDQIISQWQARFGELMNEDAAAFTEWFNNLEVILDGDVAAKLAGEITIDPTTIALYKSAGWEDPEEE